MSERFNKDGHSWKPPFQGSREAAKHRTQPPGAPESVSPLLSRRNFLIGGGALAAAATVDYVEKVSPLAEWLDDKIEGQYDYDALVKEAKRILKKEYSVELLMGRENDQEDILGDPVSLEQYRESLRVLVHGIKRYPPEMIQKVGEGRGFKIRILRQLRARHVGGHNPTHTSFAGIRRGTRQGIAEEIIIDADQQLDFQARIVHHELNHSFAGTWQSWQERDNRWIGFHAKINQNPYRPQASYGADHPAPERHFLTDYAGTMPVEDQAVSAEWMMTPALMTVFLDRWRNETDQNVKDILAWKYNETKNNYAVWSNGKLGEPFWQSLVDQGYKDRKTQLEKAPNGK